MLLAVGIFLSVNLTAEALADVDVLLLETAQYLKTTPEKARDTLLQLEKVETTLNQQQKDRYHLLLASSLAFQGKYKEEVELIKSVIDQVADPDTRSGFLYYLSAGYTSLGEYEQALIAMNEGILLLPKIVDQENKARTLQAAIVLFNSLHAYDESMLIANRMYLTVDAPEFGVAKCLGLANRGYIYLLQGKSQKGQSLLPETIETCDKHGRKIISLISKTYAAIDLINTGQDELGLKKGLPLLAEFLKVNQTSLYKAELEEAIARGYFKKSNLILAETYASSAYQRAQSENAVQLLEKSSETLAKIKRARGQSDSAMNYFEINLALKKKVLDDQLLKNLAYQRVKFDIQDKANELALSEQKNKTLQVEKTLQQGKNQNLLLMITLSLILLTILGGWLIRTLRQKNIFQVSSQIDGLTQISNRAYFIESAKLALKNPANSVSLILFDMDHFKSINDTFGHSTGDWVLRTVCNVVKSQLRPTDLFGRLGGEEFAICLTHLSEPGVLALAERCRAEVAAIDTAPSGSQFLISASFGIAIHGVRGNTSFEDILAAADKALYFSKNGGRNLVSVFQ